MFRFTPVLRSRSRPVPYVFLVRPYGQKVRSPKRLMGQARAALLPAKYPSVLSVLRTGTLSTRAATGVAAPEHQKVRRTDGELPYVDMCVEYYHCYFHPACLGLRFVYVQHSTPELASARTILSLSKHYYHWRLVLSSSLLAYATLWGLFFLDTSTRTHIHREKIPNRKKEKYKYK